MSNVFINRNDLLNEMNWEHSCDWGKPLPTALDAHQSASWLMLIN